MKDKWWNLPLSNPQSNLMKYYTKGTNDTTFMRILQNTSSLPQIINIYPIKNSVPTTDIYPMLWFIIIYLCYIYEHDWNYLILQ